MKEQQENTMLRNTLKVVVPKNYQLDFDKIKTLEDVIAILKALKINITDSGNVFGEIKHLLKEV